MNKLPTLFGNSAWQMMPSVFTLLLSLAIVRFFDAAAWGSLVAVLVVQQMANGVASWGNKDYLQRILAVGASGFDAHFTRLFAERSVLLLAVILSASLLRLVEAASFASFALLVSGRYVQQSFDILILWKRQFRLAIALEVAAAAGQLAAVWYIQGHEPTVAELMALFWIPAWIKALALLWKFKSHFTRVPKSGWLMRKSGYFALLGITGLVHSKIDVWLVSRLLDAKTLAHYQILMAFLWNVQSAAMYISSPYIHNFYRLADAARQNYARWLIRCGWVLVPTGLVLMFVLLDLAFAMTMSVTLLAASALFGMASFVYLPYILKLNGAHHESRVLAINISGTLALMVVLPVLHAFYPLTPERLIWIVAAEQWFVTLAAKLACKPQYLWKWS